MWVNGVDGEEDLERMWKEPVFVYFEVQYLHFPSETEIAKHLFKQFEVQAKILGCDLPVYSKTASRSIG
jgi:hypothetical protein